MPISRSFFPFHVGRIYKIFHLDIPIKLWHVKALLTLGLRDWPQKGQFSRQPMILLVVFSKLGRALFIRSERFFLKHIWAKFCHLLCQFKIKEIATFAVRNSNPCFKDLIKKKRYCSDKTVSQWTQFIIYLSINLFSSLLA